MMPILVKVMEQVECTPDIFVRGSVGKDVRIMNSSGKPCKALVLYT